MANDDDRLNLVQRLAEKQARKDDRPLSERAADKLAEASRPAPVRTERGRAARDSGGKPLSRHGEQI